MFANENINYSNFQYNNVKSIITDTESKSASIPLSSSELASDPTSPTRSPTFLAEYPPQSTMAPGSCPCFPSGFHWRTLECLVQQYDLASRLQLYLDQSHIDVLPKTSSAWSMLFEASSVESAVLHNHDYFM